MADTTETAPVFQLGALLDEERAVIRTAAFAALPDLIARKETVMQSIRSIPAEVLEPLRRRAEENQRLIAASLNGLETAQTRIRQIATAARSCTTYDAAGQPRQLSTKVRRLEKRA